MIQVVFSLAWGVYLGVVRLRWLRLQIVVLLGFDICGGLTILWLCRLSIGYVVDLFVVFGCHGWVPFGVGFRELFDH